MKQKLLSVFGIIIISLLLTSCSKDAPIYPDDPDFVPFNGGGKGGDATGTIDLTLLGGKWTVTSTYGEAYNSSNLVLSSAVLPINLYQGVELNDASKSFLFDASFSVPSPGTYTVSNIGTNMYIQLSDDPFSRSTNDLIQIINLTATSMTWVARDPLLNDTPGGMIKTGYKVVYTRKP